MHGIHTYVSMEHITSKQMKHTLVKLWNTGKSGESLGNSLWKQSYIPWSFYFTFHTQYIMNKMERLIVSVIQESCWGNVLCIHRTFRCYITQIVQCCDITYKAQMKRFCEGVIQGYLFGNIFLLYAHVEDFTSDIWVTCLCSCTELIHALISPLQN